MGQPPHETSYRAAFAEAAQLLVHSPLYRLLCSRVAQDRLYEDEGTFAYFLRGGASFASGTDARKVLTATHSLLRERGGRDYLSEYFPVLGGHRVPDERAFQLFREFLRDRRLTLALRLKRATVMNDPIGGVRVFRLLSDYLGRAYADPVPLDLLCVGAAAGLELVADLLDPAADLLHGHEVVRRLGVDLSPPDVSKASDLDWMLSVLVPEDVAGQDRIRAAVRLLDRAGVVVTQRDGFTVAAEPIRHRAVPVVFGVSFLCSSRHPERMDQVLQGRDGDVIWISDEAAGVLTRLGHDQGLEGVDPATRVTRLFHYRGGAVVGTDRHVATR